MRWPRVSLRRAALLFVALLAARAGIARAQFRVTDYSVVHAQSSESSLDAREVLVECPEGTFVLGGGGRTVLTAQALDSSNPTSSERHWRVRAFETVGTGQFWRVGATAICGNVAGREQVEEIEGPDSLNPKGVTARCPEGKQILGGGAFVSGPIGSNIALTSSAPDGEGWYARAYEVEPTNQTWELRVRAICGYLAGRVVVSEYGSANTTDLKYVTAACPEGTSVLSGGSFVGINAFEVLAASDKHAEGWMSIAFEPIPYDEVWTLRTDVICPEPRSPAPVAALALYAVARRRRLSAPR